MVRAGARVEPALLGAVGARCEGYARWSGSPRPRCGLRARRAGGRVGPPARQLHDQPYSELDVSGNRLYVLYVLDLAEIPTFQANEAGEIRRAPPLAATGSPRNREPDRGREGLIARPGTATSSARSPGQGGLNTTRARDPVRRARGYTARTASTTTTTTHRADRMEGDRRHRRVERASRVQREQYVVKKKKSSTAASARDSRRRRPSSSHSAFCRSASCRSASCRSASSWSASPHLAANADLGRRPRTSTSGPRLRRRGRRGERRGSRRPPPEQPARTGGRPAPFGGRAGVEQALAAQPHLVGRQMEWPNTTSAASGNQRRSRPGRPVRGPLSWTMATGSPSRSNRARSASRPCRVTSLLPSTAWTRA